MLVLDSILSVVAIQETCFVNWQRLVIKIHCTYTFRTVSRIWENNIVEKGNNSIILRPIGEILEQFLERTFSGIRVPKLPSPNKHSFWSNKDNYIVSSLEKIIISYFNKISIWSRTLLIHLTVRVMLNLSLRFRDTNHFFLFCRFSFVSH